MQVPLQIAFHNIDRTDELEALIEERMAWLEQISNRITSCHVMVEAPHRHHRRGNGYHVRIDLSLPGGEIVVHRGPSQDAPLRDLPTTIRDAFDVARRQLDDHVGRQRNGGKNHDREKRGAGVPTLPDSTDEMTS